MHKKILLMMTPALLLLTASCGHKPTPISEMKNASAADSMMYYFGEMQAAYYWQDAETDTLLRTQASRDDFMKGFKAAMKMDDDNSAYNKGLQLGLRLALRVREFQQRYGTDFSEDMLAESMEYFLRNDSAFDIREAQREYYALKNRYEFDKASAEIEDAVVNLRTRGAAKGFSAVNDTLYVKDVTPARTGRFLQEGDRIAIEISVSTIDGHEVVARQFPDSITLGEGRIPEIVRNAIYTMADGQTRQFMTTPRTLFGRRYSLYNLPYDEPVVFTIKAARN